MVVVLVAAFWEMYFGWEKNAVLLIDIDLLTHLVHCGFHVADF
jgi:hypothetical protein